jgi:uncharacterized repeat protein (TIGR03803 family)
MLACICLSTFSTSGQIYTVLRSFAAIGTNSTGNFTNADGYSPETELAISNGVIYGTTVAGGKNGFGTIFRMNADGSGFTVLRDFAPAGINPVSFQITNSDGVGPHSKLVLSHGFLYGSTEFGGPVGYGTLFRLETNGNNFQLIKIFVGGTTDGSGPFGEMVESGGFLFGTTRFGGSGGVGIVFKINTNNNILTMLHNFSSASTDGGEPNGVTLSGTTLYGTTYLGGINFWGTVFKIGTDGNGFLQLKSFSVPNPPDFTGTNSDGFEPMSGVAVFSAPAQADRLYGTTPYGGTSSNGVVFALLPTGGGFTNLHNFNASGSGRSNIGGANPVGNVVIDRGTVYGTTEFGGNGIGGVFALPSDGSPPYMLWIFGQTGNDGSQPAAGPTLAGTTLYGTTGFGGNAGRGTIYRLQIVPRLSIARSGANAVLTWPTNDLTFNLQSAPALTSTVWNAVSPAPTIVNGTNTVTTPLSSTPKFYRLSP